MRLIKQLQRGLPVVIDLSDCLCVQQRVHLLDLLQINRVLVCEMDKHVASLEKGKKKHKFIIACRLNGAVRYYTHVDGVLVATDNVRRSLFEAEDEVHPKM